MTHSTFLQSIFDNMPLAKIVFDQLGYDSSDEEDFIQTCQDVSRGGAANGFSGFIYYHDTIKFFDDNRKLIIEYFSGQYADYGCDSFFEMIRSFNCLKDEDLSDETLALCFYTATDSRCSGSDDYTRLKNALAWAALEEVANYVVMGLENREQEEN
jgi:hypothetical protein